jgi:hypothetical protein
MKNIKEALKEKQLNEVLIDKALNFFQSSVGGALRLTLPQRKHLSDTVFKIFSEACSLQDIELAELHFKKEGEVDRLKRQELQKIVEQAKANGQVVPPEVIQQQKGLTDKLMRVNPEFMVTKAYFQARLKMATELKVDSQKLELILAAKKEFDHLISNLSDDYEIDFNASESGLPSLALANTRKFEYANQFVKMPEGINYPGTHFILTQLGVIS